MWIWRLPWFPLSLVVHSWHLTQYQDPVLLLRLVVVCSELPWNILHILPPILLLWWIAFLACLQLECQWLPNTCHWRACWSFTSGPVFLCWWPLLRDLQLLGHRFVLVCLPLSFFSLTGLLLFTAARIFSSTFLIRWPWLSSFGLFYFRWFARYPLWSTPSFSSSCDPGRLCKSVCKLFWRDRSANFVDITVCEKCTSNDQCGVGEWSVDRFLIH